MSMFLQIEKEDVRRIYTYSQDPMFQIGSIHL